MKNRNCDQQRKVFLYFIDHVWPRGPFQKSSCAGGLRLAGLRFTLGVKPNPAKRDMNVWFSFIKGIRAGVEARRREIDFHAGGNLDNNESLQFLDKSH